MRRTIPVAVAAAALLASTAAAPASAAGIERISLVSTNSSGVFSAIATGAFADGGLARMKADSGTLHLSRGTITITRRPTHPTRDVDQATCLGVVTHGGSYVMVRGTGAYVGISGRGRYRGRYTVVGQPADNGCATGIQPFAQQSSLRLRGPVTLAGKSS
jgi:hypothetical protein